MMAEEYEDANKKISTTDFITTLFAAIYEQIGNNKKTVELILSDAFNDLGVPKDVIVGFRLSSKDEKLLAKSKNLSTFSKCLLTASIIIDFMDAAKVGETKGDVGQTKRLIRNLVTTLAVYKVSEFGSVIGKSVGEWAGGAIGSAILPGTGTVVGKIGGGILTGWFAQKKLDEFFEERGW
jgi:hypothetical protein